MISGKLPNGTVWWLSTDALKIWIESKDLEQEKFIDKGFYIVHGNIYRARKLVGELTTSRLDSRRYQDAWIIRLDAIADVYPGLIEEIGIKESNVKKRRRGPSRKNNKKEFKPVKEVAQIIENKTENIDIPKILTEGKTNENKTETINKIDKISNKKMENRVPKMEQPKMDHFDINRPYVIWINDEINKNNGKMRIKIKDLKEKMGEEFINMHDLRIYYGLKKILPNMGISIDLISSKGDSIVIMSK